MTYKTMKKIILSLLLCLCAVSAFAQLEYPVVYEGPDVVFRQIDEHLWVGSGNEVFSETMYIVEGGDKAVLIDNGTKIPDLDKIVKSITDKPVDMILTHAHGDHAGNSKLFDAVWLHKDDETAFKRICLGYKGEINYLEDGDTIDLGGRVLEVWHTPGHTAGSITFVDKANHYGFSGDAFGNTNLLLFTDCSTMIKTCGETLERMQDNDIYFMYNGHFHGNDQETTKQIYNLKLICEDLISGKVAGEKPEGSRQYLYAREGLRVNYNPEMLK